MNMLFYIIPFIAGAALGIFYFFTLWITVKVATSSPRPGLIMFKSYIIRSSIVILGFYMVMDGRWERAMIALSGFIIAREFLKLGIGKKPSLT